MSAPNSFGTRTPTSRPGHLAGGAGLATPTRPGALAPALAARAPLGKSTWMIDAQPGAHLVLMPGQLHFGRSAATVRTLLGSCVALTLWHAQKRVGGMCHYLLPSRKRLPGMALEGRYGDEAVEQMVQAINRLGLRTQEFSAHLYGGADTMPDGARIKMNIGERNIEQGWTLIDQYGFSLDGVDVGDNVPRTVLLDYARGEVQVKRSERI